MQGGGSLAFLGGADAGLFINNLIGPWGVKYDNNRIEASNPASCGTSGCFSVTNFANHPAAGTAAMFFANNNASVVVSQDATVLAQTTAAEWRSLSGMPTQHPGDPNGPFAMAVAQVEKAGCSPVEATPLWTSFCRKGATTTSAFAFGLGLAHRGGESAADSVR